MKMMPANNCYKDDLQKRRKITTTLLALTAQEEEDDSNFSFNEDTEEINQNLCCRRGSSSHIKTKTTTNKAMPTPNQRVGVGVTSVSTTILWGITFLALILISEVVSQSATTLNPGEIGRRRVRGVGKGRLFNISPPSSSPPLYSRSTQSTNVELEESKRLLRLESASPISYLYRYRAPRTTAPSPSPFPPTQSSYLSSIIKSNNAQPRVLLRLSGQSGVIQRRVDQDVHETISTTPPTPPQPLHHFSSYEEAIKKSDNTFIPQPELKNVVEEPDYPYHYYLDFDENKNLPQQNKEYLYPQPSEHLKPFALPETQSSLWNEFLYNHNKNEGAYSTDLTPTPTLPSPPSYLNEINDNYTIPSLRDYKFPEFKTITTTTKKPPKRDFLNPYEFFSEEDLENVAELDFDSDHSKYFVKTKPRDVSSSVANLYNSFYYEPPSYSTKSQPLPVNVKFPEQYHQHQLKNKDEDDTSSPKLHKWSRTGSNELNFNYFDDGSLVTFPMTATPSPDPDHTTQSNTNTAYLPTTSPSPIPTPAPIPPTTTPIPTNNFSEYIFSPPNKSEAEQRNDVSAAESVAILAAKASLNFNLIPDTSTFNHKDGLVIPSTSTMDTTTQPTYTPSQFSSSTPSSGSDQDTTNIPGMPGIDFPIFDEIPVTSFDCAKQRYKGFFADIESKCQVWHYCDFADGHSSFLCPNGTLFSQVLLTCDWWFNVNCIQSQQLYVLNERLYRYIKPPKPSFPEDYHGPGVDLWLKNQLELGLLPKVKKRGRKLEKPVPTTLKERVQQQSSKEEETQQQLQETTPNSEPQPQPPEESYQTSSNWDE